ncbi:MFS transporter [Actinomyces oris]|uniref:MFS transporter n=1 Tax=Actinomyces oris TaxID=544580 RepID=UPI0022FD590D|nr:MFS transporter [Actinomyces oris]WCA42629.1 MFS transporter [Actinomyces oris]
MPSAPNTDDNGTDQADTDSSTQPGAAVSGDEASMAPDTGEAEADADRNAAGPSKATTDTGDSESEGEPFPPRGALTLRALRWAGLLGGIVFGVTALVLRRGLIGAGSLIPDKSSTLTYCMIFGGLLVLPFLNFREKKRPILTTIITTVMAALGMTTSASLTLAWWDTYQETGFSVLFLLALAGAALSATLFLSAGTLLHYLRMRTTAAGIGDPNDPSRWRRLHVKTGEKTDKGLPRYKRIRAPRRTRAYLAALIIAPALTLGSAITATWSFINPVHHVTATTPTDASLAPPTSLAPKASWSKEISSTELTTVAGASGPILLTDNGVLALSSKDGSVLWSYSRKQAIFASSTSAPYARRLITSPDGKYVALRILSPKFVESTGDTLVFDALTGRLVFERQGAGGPLQLTDSAVLDGDTAFSLTDGAKMWNLPGSSGASYSGPAGHSSFILTSSEEPSSKNTPTSMYRSTVTTRVFPQNDPTAEVEVPNILSEIPSESNALDNYFSIFINGWAARYTGETDTSGIPVAEAISLDALAKVDGADTTTFPLGATSGINTEASRLSSSIVTYPVISRDASLPYPPKDSRAATVFDPVTRTVTPASQDRSLAAARTGIVEVPADDGSSSAALAIRPGDGSPGTTIPITPGSTYQPFQKLIDKDNAPIQPLFSQHTDSERPATTVRSPGAVVVIFNTTGIGYDGCSSGPGNDNQRCRDTYRIFGVTGDQR